MQMFKFSKLIFTSAYENGDFWLMALNINTAPIIYCDVTDNLKIE